MSSLYFRLDVFCLFEARSLELEVRVGQACARLTHAWVKFSWVTQRSFLTAPYVCHGSNCSPPPLPHRTEQRMGQIVCGSDCHSQCLDPFLRGRTERFGGGRTVRTLWGRIVTLCKRLWGEWCGVVA